MEAPQQIRPQRLADYLEVMTTAVFQSGMSWQVVEAKWDGFREAFAAFDPVTVAAFSAKETISGAEVLAWFASDTAKTTKAAIELPKGVRTELRLTLPSPDTAGDHDVRHEYSNDHGRFRKRTGMFGNSVEAFGWEDNSRAAVL